MVINSKNPTPFEVAGSRVEAEQTQPTADKLISPLLDVGSDSRLSVKGKTCQTLPKSFAAQTSADPV